MKAGSGVRRVEPVERQAPGTPPAAAEIPLCVPEIRGNEWRYVKECLDTGWVSSAGAFVDRFEEMLSTYLGARHGIATVNGTAALHVAVVVAGVVPEDEVLVSDLTFVAPANAISYAGARPVFMDAQPDTWEMDPEKVVEFLDTQCEWRRGALYNKVTRRRVKAVLPVHILGHPVHLQPILEKARQYGLTVIEDATEALGATYKGQMAGHLGEIACLSFNGNKIITTGGGGLVVTDRADWAERVRYLTTQAKDDPVEYVHNAIGYNYRLTNIQAAMGVAQMELLDEYIAAKRRIARYYHDHLSDVAGITLPPEAAWAKSTFWMYTVLIDPDVFGTGSRALLQRLAGAGIQTRPLWRPLHRLAPYQDCQAYKVEVADRLHDVALSLPCSVGISEGSLQHVVRTLIASHRAATEA